MTELPCLLCVYVPTASLYLCHCAGHLSRCTLGLFSRTVQIDVTSYLPGAFHSAVLVRVSSCAAKTATAVRVRPR